MAGMNSRGFFKPDHYQGVMETHPSSCNQYTSSENVKRIYNLKVFRGKTLFTQNLLSAYQLLLYLLLKSTHCVQDGAVCLALRATTRNSKTPRTRPHVSKARGVWSKCPWDTGAWKCFIHVDLTEDVMKYSAWTGSAFGPTGRASKLCWWELNLWHHPKSASWEKWTEIQFKSWDLLQKACVL